MSVKVVAPVDINQVVRLRSDCRLCGSKNLVNIWSFGQTPLANSYVRQEDTNQPEVFAPLEVVQCQTCHLVQLRHVVDPVVLFANYLYVSSTSPTFIRHFHDYAERLISYFKLTSSDLVVDVGSNDGILLQPLKQRGIRTLGIEPAKNIAALANAAGIETISEFFTPALARQLVQEKGHAKVISANNVFAHTDDIQPFVEAVKALLAPDGAYVFEVQYLGDLVAKNLFDIVYHEHLCYYHVRPLVSFFAQAGMEVFDVERPSVHGGSIRVYVQHQGGPHVRQARLAAILHEEEQQGLNTLTPYQSFAARIADNKAMLVRLLRQLKAAGKRIVGYGAPAKATTLMYAFGIDGSLIDYIVDDDATFKQGRAMPGTHIPITSPSRLYADAPDYCLILAWNFAESIMKNHQRFIDQGGKFIVPVPKPAIIES